MKIRYLTLDVVIAIHHDLIERYGGSHGIRDLGLLQSAIFRPQSSFGGEDLYPGIFEKAGALFHSLIFNHPFLDGNKRTSITATARFLFLNGYKLDVSLKEFVEFPIKVEREHPDISEISRWLKDHSRRIRK